MTQQCSAAFSYRADYFAVLAENLRKSSQIPNARLYRLRLLLN